MKYVQLRVEQDSEGVTLDWREVTRSIIRRPLDMQKGAEIEEIRKGIRVLDAVDQAEPNLLGLEDADWEHLKEKTLKFAWGVVDRRVLQYIDDVLGATEKPTLNGVFEELREPA